eukprot:6112930-Amphidinium_carterae.1
MAERNFDSTDRKALMKREVWLTRRLSQCLLPAASTCWRRSSLSSRTCHAWLDALGWTYCHLWCARLERSNQRGQNWSLGLAMRLLGSKSTDQCAWRSTNAGQLARKTLSFTFLMLQFHGEESICNFQKKTSLHIARISKGCTNEKNPSLLCVSARTPLMITSCDRKYAYQRVILNKANVAPTKYTETKVSEEKHQQIKQQGPL